MLTSEFLLITIKIQVCQPGKKMEGTSLNMKWYKNVKRIIFVATVFLASILLYLPCNAEEKILGNEILFEQTYSSADGTQKSILGGIKITNWYNWFTLHADGFNDLYDALSTEGAQLYIKYLGEYNISASFTLWGTVSAVGCTSVKEEDGYKYAIFDAEAVGLLFEKYSENKANKDEKGNLNSPMALSLDGQAGEGKCNTIYGLYVVSSGPIDATAKITATIDMDKTYQSIDGFGASYTWYSDWLTNVDRAEQGYDWIFSDAEFNILRFRDQHGLGNDEKYEPVNGYKKYKAYYDAAVSRGISPIVMVTSWGQYDRNLPFVAYTEKSKKGYSYYTLAKNDTGEYMYEELAEFCVQSVQYFIDAGIPVHYFSIANEIELQERHVDEQGNSRDEAGFFYGQEETDDYCAYWMAHIAVYNAFQKAFGDNAPSIIGAETMSGDKGLLTGYLEKITANNPEMLDVVAHHLYGTTLSSYNFETIYNKFSNYHIWQTEWYNNNYFELGDVILNELISENISAFLYWNGVWIYDEGNCLIEISTWEPSAEIKRMPGHYIMMHFSKFIKNGYLRVDVTENLNSKVGAFKSSDNSKLVVVVSNNTGKEDVLHLSMQYEIKSSSVYQSCEDKQKYMIEAGEFSDGMKIPSNSLTTIVFELGERKEPEPEPTETSAETSAGTSGETSTEAPNETPAEMPEETTPEIPVETPVETPSELPKEEDTLTEVPFDNEDITTDNESSTKNSHVSKKENYWWLGLSGSAVVIIIFIFLGILKMKKKKS